MDHSATLGWVIENLYLVARESKLVAEVDHSATLGWVIENLYLVARESKLVFVCFDCLLCGKDIFELLELLFELSLLPWRRKVIVQVFSD